MYILLFLSLIVSFSDASCTVTKPSGREMEILTAELYCGNRTDSRLHRAISFIRHHYRGEKRFLHCEKLEKEKRSSRETKYSGSYTSELSLNLLAYGCQRFVDSNESYTFEYSEEPSTLDERLMESINQFVIWLAYHDACDPQSKQHIMESCHLIQSKESKRGVRTLERGYLLLAACQMNNQRLK